MPSRDEKILLRRARPEDSEKIMSWRNDPVTRRYFFDPLPVDPVEHNAWFSATLINPTLHLLIGEDLNRNSIGVVRFDQKSNSATISIYLVPQNHCKGLGLPLLEAAVRWIERNSTVKHIHADVLEDNVASIKLFTRAGFRSEDLRRSLKIFRS